MKRTTRRSCRLVVMGVLVLLLGGCAALSPATRKSGESPSPVSATAGAGSALVELNALPVKGQAPMTGYARAEFGVAWTDANTAPWGGNDLQTRDDVLSRDLTAITCKSPPPKKAAPHCTVESGVLHDPYTGATIRFTRGPVSSMAVQIDHVVALGDAWQTGAQQLTSSERTNLANDPLNLIAVDQQSNDAKGDLDAASWLPPNLAFRCAYVARQVAVKAEYRLWITSAEGTAMSQVLATCANQPLPSEVNAERRTY